MAGKDSTNLNLGLVKAVHIPESKQISDDDDEEPVLLTLHRKPPRRPESLEIPSRRPESSEIPSQRPGSSQLLDTMESQIFLTPNEIPIDRGIRN